MGFPGATVDIKGVILAYFLPAILANKAPLFLPLILAAQ
jgi:hypothetical protein